MQQNAKSNLGAALSEEACFISEGFSNWKKALARFKEHQVSECRKIAIANVTLVLLLLKLKVLEVI